MSQDMAHCISGRNVIKQVRAEPGVGADAKSRSRYLRSSRANGLSPFSALNLLSVEACRMRVFTPSALNALHFAM